MEKLEDEVRSLKTKLAMKQGPKHSKKELRELYGWSQQEVVFSQTIMEFCKEFLFPRIKFLGKNWTEDNRTSKRSFSEIVRRNLPVPRGMSFEKAWQ